MQVQGIDDGDIVVLIRRVHDTELALDDGDQDLVGRACIAPEILKY